jgi:hypothetical protein
MRHSKHGLDKASASTEDLRWVVGLLNAEQTIPLSVLARNLCELNYGDVSSEAILEAGRKVELVFRQITSNACLRERDGRFSITFLPREGDTVFQTDALHIADLAGLGLLARIHQCPHCGRWFLFKRERRPYLLRKPCPGRCYIAIHRKKTEVKHKRAAYMRKRYREVKASLNVKKSGLSKKMKVGARRR